MYGEMRISHQPPISQIRSQRTHSLANHPSACTQLELEESASQTIIIDQWIVQNSKGWLHHTFFQFFFVMAWEKCLCHVFLQKYQNTFAMNQSRRAAPCRSKKRLLLFGAVRPPNPQQLLNWSSLGEIMMMMMNVVGGSCFVI